MAKIRKIYDQTIKPDGSKTTIYPITSTRAVYTPEGVTLDSYLKDGYFHGADLRGYKTVSNVTDLPTTENQFGWLIGEDLYVWVGTGGDTLGGLYQNCGHFRTPYVPDDEDLVANSDNELKLKDRTIEDGGKGYVILRKNIVSGVNTLTQSMMTQENTIYEIRYDFTLGENITIPANCILKFEGGSISGDGTGKDTILNSSLNILASKTKIFNNVKLNYNDLFFVEWYGVNISNTDNSSILQNLINNVNSDGVLNCKFTSGTYNFNTPVTLRRGVNLIGVKNSFGRQLQNGIRLNNATILNNTGSDYLFIKDQNDYAFNKVEDLNITCTSTGGGINFTAGNADQYCALNIILTNVNFYNIKNKAALILQTSWRCQLLNCHWNFCSVAIAIRKSTVTQINDSIQIINPVIENCAIGILGEGSSYAMSILGGVIEAIAIDNEYNLRISEDIKSFYNTELTAILSQINASSIDEVSGAFIHTGSIQISIDSLYLEDCQRYFYFGQGSSPSLCSLYINDTVGATNVGEQIVIAPLASNVIVTNCRITHNDATPIFNINTSSKRSIILGNVYYSSVGVEFNGALYKDTINEVVKNTYCLLESNIVGRLQSCPGFEDYGLLNNKPIENLWVGRRYFVVDGGFVKPIYYAGGGNWVDATGQAV